MFVSVILAKVRAYLVYGATVPSFPLSRIASSPISAFPVSRSPVSLAKASLPKVQLYRSNCPRPPLGGRLRFRCKSPFPPLS